MAKAPIISVELSELNEFLIKSADKPRRALSSGCAGE